MIHIRICGWWDCTYGSFGKVSQAHNGGVAFEPGSVYSTVSSWPLCCIPHAQTISCCGHLSSVFLYTHHNLIYLCSFDPYGVSWIIDTMPRVQLLPVQCDSLPSLHLLLHSKGIEMTSLCLICCVNISFTHLRLWTLQSSCLVLKITVVIPCEVRPKALSILACEFCCSWWCTLSLIWLCVWILRSHLLCA
jgi:hypothetical protein